jgi:hypothetical protein
MDLFRRSDGRTAPLLLSSSILSGVLAAVGCASPGPPRAPSLRLPQPVRNLTVARIGNTVELHFTAPSNSTDKLPLRAPTIPGQLCRQLDHQPCIPVPASKTSVATAGPKDTKNLVTWTDTLPPDLAQGSPHLLAYRVEFFSPTGRSAGPSDPAFTATGTPPAPVEDLHAQGSRLGIVLQWNPSPLTGNLQPGDLLLKREDLAPPPPKAPKPSTTPTPTPTKPSKHTSASTSSIVWLETPAPTGPTPPGSTLDTTALPGTPYRYSAQRRETLHLGAHAIELRSALSAPIAITLHQIYPPPAPTGLTAAGFFPTTPTGASSDFAVDLIWQPINDTNLIAGLAGYNLYREPLDAANQPTAPPTQLNTAPILLPSFHDTTANSTTPYRYTVTAIDTQGNQSPAATVQLQPSAPQ